MMLASNRKAGVPRPGFSISRDHVVPMAVLIVAVITSGEALTTYGRQMNEVPEDFSAVINVPRTQHFDYAPYLKAVSEPLPKTELENILDLNDRDLANEFNFDPTHLLTLLIEKAAAQGTTPEKFFEEMQDLLASQNHSKSDAESQNVTSSTEPTENLESSTFQPTGNDGLSPFDNADSSVELDENPTESSEVTIPTTETATTFSTTPTTDLEENSALNRLEKKYNVTSKCNGRDAITPFRLTLMFPHYQNLGQKPFVNTSYTDIRKDSSFSTGTTIYRNGYYEYHVSPSKTVRVPSFFTRHEFGGLIPQSGLTEGVKNAIIAMHLYSLYQDEDVKSASVPFRAKCVLLKWRMERSLVSDDRRVRFLQNNEILTEDGQLTSGMSSLYNDLVTSKFNNKIFWKIFK